MLNKQDISINTRTKEKNVSKSKQQYGPIKYKVKVNQSLFMPVTDPKGSRRLGCQYFKTIGLLR
jgi:hypothetical protein